MMKSSPDPVDDCFVTEARVLSCPDRPSSPFRRRTAAVALGLAVVGIPLFAGSTAPAGAAPTGPATPGAGAQDTNDAEPGERLPTRGPVDASSTTRAIDRLNLVDGLLRGEPIVDGDFADPFALSERDSIYIYATNTVDANIPVMELRKGQDLTARYLGDALPKLPSWTVKGFQWAPSVWARPDGTFVMYYVTPSSSAPTNKGCISRATSKDPAGPFVDDSTSAFICPLSQGGAIDPSVFIDSVGTPYLIWKNDGNCCSLPTNIYSQELSSDGLDVAGDPVELITATQKWEGNLVEGPSMIKKGSTHYLFYSANNWNSTNYAIGAATCTSVAGPCTKPTSTPWMASTANSQGPGGEEFFVSPGASGVWMVHHGWLPDQAGTPDGQRRLYLDRVSFESGDVLPVRSDTVAVEEALFEDAAFLALLVGLVIGVILVAGVTLNHRRRHGVDDGSD